MKQKQHIDFKFERDDVRGRSPRFAASSQVVPCLRAAQRMRCRVVPGATGQGSNFQLKSRAGSPASICKYTAGAAQCLMEMVYGSLSSPGGASASELNIIIASAEPSAWTRSLAALRSALVGSASMGQWPTFEHRHRPLQTKPPCTQEGGLDLVSQWPVVWRAHSWSLS